MVVRIEIYLKRLSFEQRSVGYFLFILIHNGIYKCKFNPQLALVLK
jgi:hypothetical protein